MPWSADRFTWPSEVVEHACSSGSSTRLRATRIPCARTTAPRTLRIPASICGRGRDPGGFAVAGTFSGDIELGGVRLQGAPGDAFLARHDAGGEPLWAVVMSAPVAGTRSIAVAPLGRLVAVGPFLGSRAVGEHALESAGGFDAFVVDVARPVR